MKNSFPSLLPALALFALGGCASTTGLSTTESDGVYYSSQDRSTMPARNQQAAPTEQQLADGEIVNPDYNAQTDTEVVDGTASTEYYDDGYSYAGRIRRFHQPYYSNFGYGYNDFIYSDPYWYGGSAMYSPYGGGFGYPYGGFGGLSIGLSFGNPWYRPWGYGYPYGGYGYGYGGYYDSFYSPYGMYNPYGYGGFYGSPYSYGGYGYGYGNGYSSPVRYGARSSRSAEAGGRLTNGNTTSGTSAGRGRVSQGGIVAPGNGGVTTNGLVDGNGRGRVQSSTGAANGAVATPTTRGGGRGQVTSAPTQTQPQTQLQDAQSAATRGGRLEQVNTRVTEQPALQQQPQTRGWRTNTQAGQAAGQAAESVQPRRSRFSEVFNGGTQNSGSYQQQQPQRQRTYQAPQQTYEAPSRSYSPPSGGGGGGGSFGGGGGGGSRGGGGGGGGRGGR